MTVDKTTKARKESKAPQVIRVSQLKEGVNLRINGVSYSRPVKLVFKPTGGTIWQEVGSVDLASSSVHRALVHLITLADGFNSPYLYAGTWAVKQGRTVLVSRNSDTLNKWEVNTQKLQIELKSKTSVS